MNLNDLEVKERAIVGIIEHYLAGINPLISEMQLAALTIDIENKGQLAPVIMYKGKLVDGRSRVKAINEIAKKDGSCRDLDFLGGKVKYIDLPHNTTKSEVLDILQSLETRRMQTKTQLAVQAFMAKQNGSKKTIDELAKEKGVARVSVARCKRIFLELGLNTINELQSGFEITITNSKGTKITTDSISTIYSTLGERKKEETKKSHSYALTEQRAREYSRYCLGKYCKSKQDAMILLKAIQDDVFVMLED